MRPFWRGFYRVWWSRLSIDAWLLVCGFAIGTYIERGRWESAFYFGLCTLGWLWASRIKQQRVLEGGEA